MDATVTGTWLPEVQPLQETTSSTDPPDPAMPADVGIKIGQNNWPDIPCCDFAYGALRDLSYNLVTEIPDPDGGGPMTATPVVEPVNAQGEFSSYSQHLSNRSGWFDTWIQPFLDDARGRGDLTGDDALNQHNVDATTSPDTVTPIPNAPKSTYVVSGNLVTLTIPVEINVDDPGPGNISQYFDGQFVATFEISADSDGDYNDDGTVDAADYVAWRKLPDMFGGDPEGYEDWRKQFGEPGTGSGGGGTVPEPTGVILAMVGFTAMLFGRGRSHH
jgi:hypothetical protein